MKKPIYKRKWFIALIAFLILCGIGGGGSDDKKPAKDQNAAVSEEQKKEQKEQEQKEEKKTPDEIASEMGQNYFTTIQWDDVFKYKAKVHYILDYTCGKTKDNTYGDYVATAGATLQNGFGAEFESTIYIFMDKNGIIQHVAYEEADGSIMEIPMDQLPANL